MKRDMKILGICGMLSLSLLTGCSGGAQRVEAVDIDVPQIFGMKSEFVPAGGEAVIYGSSLAGAKVYFDTQFYNDSVQAEVISSEDDKIVVRVPDKAWMGKIKVKNLAGVTTSNFIFRDERNIIIDFDTHHQTWGGIVPFDHDGNLVQGQIENDSIHPYAGKLIEGCSGKFGLLHGTYPAKHPYIYVNDLWFQYMHGADEGGRGAVSIAGLPFYEQKIEDLVLKFECNIPKEAAYKGIATEFIAGYASKEPDKIGRTISPICRWEPYKNDKNYYIAGQNSGKDLSNGFYTDGWETITIPLTAFNYVYNEDQPKENLKLDLAKAVNFSVLVFGKPETDTHVMIAFDNFRIVPKSE